MKLILIEIYNFLFCYSIELYNLILKFEVKLKHFLLLKDFIIFDFKMQKLENKEMN